MKLLTISNSKPNYFLLAVLQVIFSALFLGLFAKVQIPLFFTPVPIALQNSISISFGYFLKSKKAFLSIMLFVFLAAIGFPFFSNGNSGSNYLMSTNGGYIFGYAIAGYVVGLLFEKTKNFKVIQVFLNVLIGHLIVLFCGFIWLSSFLGLKNAFLLGVICFIPIDIFKALIITKLIKTDY